MSNRETFNLEVIALSETDLNDLQTSGAAAIELCAAIDRGGLTPALTLIQAATKSTLPVRVMIRPTDRDFVYTDAEFRQMLSEIDVINGYALEGIVTGILTADGEIDVPRMRELIQHVGDFKVTFHRAFEEVRDPVRSYEALAALGIDSILTSKPFVLPESMRHGAISLRIGGGITAADLPKLRDAQLMKIHMGRAVRTDGSYNTRISSDKIKSLITQ